MSVEATAELNGAIGAVRHFNRFYTRQIGLLEEGLLNSRFTLTEGRVLYELARREGLTAATLSRDLGLDRGYLSRILKKFESEGLLARAPAGGHGRRAALALTEAGREAFAPLDQASRRQVASLLEPLSAPGRNRLAQAMATIERLLAGAPDSAPAYSIRPPRAGDIGWVVHRHGVLYAKEYGWDDSFEGFVAEIAGAFLKRADGERERAWIAERGGEIVGSVFVMRDSEAVAKLRLLYVEPGARGMGIGRRLVEEAIGFARDKGYSALTLWTNDVLVSARRIYEAAGFRLAREEPHRSFGKDLVGQHWELPLRGPGASDAG
jgi:DNA-binding MarR family transcriptional regulator/GNAT superfamily N-acetyltransferase